MTGRWFDSSPRTQNLKRGEVEVIRRLLVVLSLSASLLVGTCFAWDSESFIGNDYSMYAIGDTPAIRRASRSVSAYAAESGFSATVLSGIDLFSRFSFAHDTVSAVVRVYHESKIVAGVSVPAWEEFRSSPVDGVVLTPHYDKSNFYVSAVIPTQDNLNNGDYEGVYGFCVPPYNKSEPNMSFRYDLSLEGLSSFSSFELSGILFPFYTDSPSTESLSLYVNGALMETFYPDSKGWYDFGSYIFTKSVPITSVYFVVDYPLSYVSGSDAVSSYSLWLSFFGYDFTFSILSGSDALGGISDNTQSKIDEMEGLETDWGQKMAGNFNSLSVSDFTFPTDFENAPALLTGIFQDIWYAFGDYKILFVFPLTLAVCSVLVGRLSRSRSSSSAGSGRYP